MFIHVKGVAGCQEVSDQAHGWQGSSRSAGGLVSRRDEGTQIARRDPDDVQDANVRQPTVRTEAVHRGRGDAQLLGDLLDRK